MIKGYTNVEQSKTLAEILPLESADMSYSIIHNIGQEPYHCNVPMFAHAMNGDIPCWSLTALLDVLPDEITDDGDVYRNMFFHLKGKYIIQYPRLTTLWPALFSVEADNPIDACYKMTIKLKEQNSI